MSDLLDPYPRALNLKIKYFDIVLSIHYNLINYISNKIYWRELQMIKITSHGIIGTKIQIFEAWTPTTLKGEYISLSRIDGELHGRIGTSRTGYYKDQYQKAYDAILSEHPELLSINFTCSDGRIEIIRESLN